MAYRGHMVVPTTHEKADKQIEKLERFFAIRFGGYSKYEGTGGWDADGHIETEDHVRFVVTCPESDSLSYEGFKGCLEVEAYFVKENLDQEAVLVEFEQVDRKLV